MLDQDSPEAAQERVTAALPVVCDPRAVLPLALRGPVAPSCRAAATRSACAKASRPHGLVELDLHPAVAYVDATEEDEEEPEEEPFNYLGEMDAARQMPRLTVEELEERSECAREARAMCYWVRPLPEDDTGICLANVAGDGQLRQRQLDTEVAICMADNGIQPGTDKLTGCQEGYSFCESVEIEESPGSYACMHKAILKPDVHQLWFYYYLSCSGAIGEDWEEFCSLARRSVYENLRCPECAAAADAAAPHQRLCATADSEFACVRLNATLLG